MANSADDSVERTGTDERAPSATVSVKCPRCGTPPSPDASCPDCGGDGILLLVVDPAEASLPDDELLQRYPINRRRAP